ncbi:MAG: hemerythrin domain-containing protein [Bacteroidia bacterium]|nr:hemerythrin domain-containing protein [Bacteroidia bacterium]MCO5254849.1 hemerythrin domain-containing protein [Bacteroidota bacterium]MCZ2128926.1 hemerythrin domain-containing protein [Bacteroidia bacterium]
MNKAIYHFFTDDHREIEELLNDADSLPVEIKPEPYNQFRTRLLTHIKMEEKVLFPAAQEANGGIPLELQAKLRLDHGAITALMVPPPNKDLIKVIRFVLEVHDRLEEDPGGMYDICESLTLKRTEELLQTLRNIPVVPVVKHNPEPFALESAKRSLIRAGFDFDSIISQINSEQGF